VTTPNSNVTHLDALLVLEDGRAFRGRGIGAPSPAFGEVVFNTSMTGYQEIATDPSYRGQLVALTASRKGAHGAPACCREVMRTTAGPVAKHQTTHRFAIDYIIRNRCKAPSAYVSGGTVHPR
jgi:carbamoylphosphate synthase small subunit